MTRTVVVAREDTPFKEIARLMSEHRVSGLPVLDAEDRLVGIVSEGDLLAAEDGGRHRSLILEWFIGRRRLEEIEAKGDDLKARDVMMRDVVTIGPDEPIDAAARTMLTNGVKRLPVVDGEGKVIGIVSRTDVLRPYLREDEAIRKEIVEDVILDTMWIDPSTVHVEVKEGVVILEGPIETKSTKDLLVDLVRRVSGVVGVEDRLSFMADDREPAARPPAMPSFNFGRERLTG
jgi:CBS domain-containing protein